jgi:hypothetical protein
MPACSLAPVVTVPADVISWDGDAPEVRAAALCAYAATPTTADTPLGAGTAEVASVSTESSSQRQVLRLATGSSWCH